MKNATCDLHVHSGLKGFGAHDTPEFNQRTIWEFFPEREKEMKRLNFGLKMAVKDLAKASQANLDACAEAGLTAPFLTIYPVERGMFALDPQKPFKNLFKLFLNGKQPVYLGSVVSGFPPERVEAILKNVEEDENDGVDYYKLYCQERDYLIDQTAEPSKVNGHTFKIAADYEEFQESLRKGNTITGILTVEGAHSFGDYPKHSTFGKTFDQLTSDELRIVADSFRENITAVKQEADGKPAPFFVTFCHHFNNLLAGHARSFSDKSSVIGGIGWPNTPGMRHLLNQEVNLKSGFSILGREMLELFLNRKKGKRILIDTKHMSVATRREFYRIIRRKRVEENDHIPIIHSHGAVNAWPTLDEAARHEENKNLDKNQYFSRWQINLTDEDILETYDSDGLIGIVLHEGRMPGGSFKEHTKKLKKKIKKANGDEKVACEQALKEHYLQLILSNIFHILKVVHDQRGENAWKMLAFGSDFDGLIDPFDSFAGVTCYKDISREIADYLNGNKVLYHGRMGEAVPFKTAEIRELLFGESPEKRAEQICFANVDRFLSKYFTADYLAREQEHGMAA